MTWKRFQTDSVYSVWPYNVHSKSMGKSWFLAYSRTSNSVSKRYILLELRVVCSAHVVVWPRDNWKWLFFVDALGKHPLCHRMCKVTKETLEANKIIRNAIDSTSITFRWTSSSSRQSVFSKTTIAKKTEENGSQSRKSDYLVKMDVRTFARIKTVIWDQLLATN